MKFYRAWSMLENFKHSRNVPVIWYCIYRKTPIIPYNMLIENYDPKDPFVNVFERYVNEFLTKAEVEKLERELLKENINLYFKEVEIPMKGVSYPYASMQIDSAHGTYYLYMESYYQMGIPVSGYYNLNTHKCSWLGAW